MTSQRLCLVVEGIVRLGNLFGVEQQRPADVIMVKAGGVGRRVAHGFAWNITQSILERFLAASGQLLLARLLQKRDFGLIALTYTVTTFASLLQQFGIKQALIQRNDDFVRWATPAHWMSSTIGVIAAGATILVAPAVATYYHEPQLEGLLMVAAVGFPVAAMAAVPEARLTAEMRFTFQAKLAMVGAAITFGISLICAQFLRWGPYSILLPPVIVGLLRLPVIWVASGVKVKFSLCLHDWSSLFGTSAVLLAASVVMIATYVGPISLMGRLTSRTDLVGAFYFMHQLSDQPARMLVANLAAVMLPALALLRAEPARQGQGFERAIRGILLVGVPVCAVQAVVSGPIVRLLLPTKYHSSSWLLSLLSLYMVGRLVMPLVETMLTAQRRQKAWLGISLTYTPMFLATCLAGIKLSDGTIVCRIGNSALPFGPGERCAIGMIVCAYFVIPIALIKCFEPLGSSFSRVWNALRFPLIGSGLCAGCASMVVSALPPTALGDITTIVLAPILMFGTYYWACRRYAPDDLADLFTRLQAIAPAWLVALFSKLHRGL